MNNIIFQEGKLHVCVQWLQEERNVSKGTINDWRLILDFLLINGKRYVQWDLIPPFTRAKLPYEELTGIYQKELIYCDVDRITKEVHYIVGYNYGDKLPKVKELSGLPENKCVSLAKKWVASEWFLNNHRQGPNSAAIRFAVWKQVFPDTNLKKENSLNNWFSICKKKGLENVIIDKRKDNSAPTKITPDVVYWVMEFVKLDVNWTGAEIHRKLIEICANANRPAPSIRWVTDRINDLLRNPVIFKQKYGAAKANLQEVHAKIIPAKNIHSQWQCDAKRISVFGEDAARYNLYLVMDNHSQKIIAWNVGVSENTPLILKTINDAIEDTGFIPYEFVFDKVGFHKTNMGQHFNGKVEELGSHITDTTNPLTKRFVEYNNRKLDAHTKSYYGYIGQGMKAKNKNARRKDENYPLFIKNPYSFDEITAMMGDVILTYNNTPASDLGNKTPNEAFADSTNKKGIPITDEMRLQIIKPTKIYTVRRGQITIQEGTVKHEYQLSGDALYKYNDKQVKVVYEDYRDGIYLFDADTDVFITDLKPKRGIHGAMADQDENDAKGYHILKGKKEGVYNKGKRNIAEIIRQALLYNPDAVEYLASHIADKDVRAEAEKNSELRKVLASKNINVNKLPYRKPNSNLSEMPDDTKQKGSVFHPKETMDKLKFFNPAEQDEE